ncbi:MAG: hypothetical protein GF364_22330 [Candidatus Lokiarchaeota archaeon]|nr:hypothetical protein [Candidatus Lokiarchaeota archaeon]
MGEKKRLTTQDILKDKIPITGSNVVADYKSLILIPLFTLAFLLTLSANLWYFDRLISERNWYDIMILPLNLYGEVWLFTLVSAGLSALSVIILKKIHPINIGIFDLNTKEGKEEFKYYKLRYWCSYYALWVGRATPLPWADMLIFKMLGLNMGSNVCLYDSWMDVELVDIGDFVMTSLNTALLSHVIYDDYFIQLPTVCSKNSITGGQSLVAPGTFLGEGGILGAACSTYMGQKLKGNLIHVGDPVRRTFPIRIGEKVPVQKKAEVKKDKKRKRRKKKDVSTD